MGLGDNEQAKLFFGKVLEIDPNNEPVQEVLKKLDK